MCTVCMPSAHGNQKRWVYDPWVLGTELCISVKSSKCSSHSRAVSPGLSISLRRTGVVQESEAQMPIESRAIMQINDKCWEGGVA